MSSAAGRRPVGDRERVLLVAVAALLLSACLPLTRVYLGVGFLFPVVAAALLALAVDTVARRLGAGPGLTLIATVLGWVLFTGLAFTPDSLFGGIVPTPATLGALRAVWLEGVALARVSPAPTYAEPALLLLTVTGVWAVAHAVDGLVVRLAAPLSAVVLALVLWTVPLALVPPSGAAWLWAVPFLAAAAGLLLSSAGEDLGRFGRWVSPGDPAGLRAHRSPLTTSGTVIAACAIVVGVLVAGALPGYGETAWYELRGAGGTNLTTNPIVGMHTRLVSNNLGPVMRVTTPRPLYLRTTSLDVYDGAREEWTNGGIAGEGAQGILQLGAPIGQAQRVPVNVEIVDLPGGLLVPMPYQTFAVQDSAGDRLRYDPGLSTFFVDSESALAPGDRFEAIAAVPDPSAEQLELAGRASDPALVALPDIPPEVGQLARDIVARAGAGTPLEQAIAIQDELRRWEYSLDVVPNHRRTAMLAFLERRSGYCEQFASTMAIMLRELGIPARVAVGFTPGLPDVPEAVGTGQPVTYTVSLMNAHAWVEVLFPGYGWIAFEPTPRSDGNVIVPTASNLAPSATVTRPERSTPTDIGGQPEDFERGGQDAGDPLAAQAGNAPGGVAAPARRRSGLALSLVALAVLAGAAATLLVVRARRRRRPARSPLERVLRVREHVRRLGSGLKLPPRPAETDVEYLDRLVGLLPTVHGPLSAHRREAEQAADALARRAEQAQWARDLPEGAAEDAEQAAGTLTAALLDDRRWAARLLIRTRAALAGLRPAPRRSVRGRRRTRPEREQDRELVSADRP